MNKKILSFVLAMVLSVGLGSSVFAYEYTGGVNGTNSRASISLDDLENQRETGQINRTGTDVAGATEATNRVCAVFNYAAGVVLSVMDSDRNLTLYSGGNPFISLGYNEDGSFTVTGVNIQGTDIEAVEAAGGLKNFLLALGVPESALKCSETKDGVVTEGQKDVAWLAQAEEQLKKGINHSISINFTSQYGASVTYCENGKSLETIGYDGTQIAKYNYNAAGTLETIEQLTYEVDSTDVSGKNENTRITGATAKPTVNTVHLNEFGKQDYVTNSKGTVVTQYSYSSNGSIASVYDATKNETTFYAGGKAAYVINDNGFKTAEYFYHENGSLDGIKSYNYDQDKGIVTGTTITAYRWGSAVGTADLSSGTGVQTFDQLRAAVDSIKANPSAALESLKAGAAGKTDASNSSIFGNITSIALYTSDLKNSALMNFLGIKSEDVAAMRRMSNGYSSVGNASITIDTIDFGTKTNDNGVSTKGGKFASYSTSKTISNGVVGEQMSVKLTIMDHGGQSYQVNCGSQTLRAAVDAVVEKTTFVDPAVVGTVTDIVTIDGKKYAVLENAQVDILDGKGFQDAKDGEGKDEKIYVCLDGLDEEPQIGDTFSAAGYIDTDADGNFAINNVYASNISDKNVKAAAEDFAKTLATNDTYQANLKSNMEFFQQIGFNGDWQTGWNLLTKKEEIQQAYASGAVPAQF
jgi:hypothetical protein